MKAISLWQPYLCGVLHGDGWCTALNIGLRCKDREFAETFASSINDGFNLSVQPKTDERGYWLVRVGNKSGMFSALRGYEPIDAAEKCAWLRGMFDSEGNAQLWHMPHISPNAYHRRIAFYSTEIGTLRRAADYLNSMGITRSIRATRNSASHIGSKIVHELRLTGRDAFKAFATLVGSSITRKNARLQRISESYQTTTDYLSRGGTNGCATRVRRALAGGKY